MVCTTNWRRCWSLVGVICDLEAAGASVRLAWHLKLHVMVIAAVLDPC